MAVNGWLRRALRLPRKVTAALKGNPLLAKIPTIRTRLALFAIACMALALAFGAGALISDARESRQAVEREMQETAFRSTLYVERETAVEMALLTGLSMSHALQTGDLETFYREASKLEKPAGSWILLTDPNAIQLVNTRFPFGAALPVFGPEIVRRARATVETRQSRISDVVFGPSGPSVHSHGSVVATMPIIRKGDVVYLLDIIIPAANFDPILGRGKDPAQWFTEILDRKGGVVAKDTNPEHVEDQPDLNGALPEGGHVSDGTSMSVTTAGKPVFIAYRHSKATGWTVIVSTSLAALDAPLDRAIRLIGFGAGILLLCALGITFVGGRPVTQPLRARIAASEERLREITEKVPSILFTVDPDGQVDYVSNRFYSYTGLPAGAAEGRGWLATVHPDDRLRIQDVQSGSAAETTPGEVEIRLLSRNGSYRWFAVRSDPIRDASGRIIKLFGTATDIETLKQTEQALHALTSQLLKAQDGERRRIAREVHDSTAQNVVAALMQIDQLRHEMIPPGSARLRAMNDAHDLLARSLSELRTLSYVLHPPFLEKLGLGPALQNYVRGFEKRSGIRVTLEVSEALPRLSLECEEALFRVVQESLTNIQRHSHGAESHIKISHDSRQITLDIADRGMGMPADIDGDIGSFGVGIPGMRFRVQQLGGSFEIQSSPDGTTVRTSMPLTTGEARKGAVWHELLNKTGSA